VHEFTKAGVEPLRLEIVGFGEFHPRQSNDSVEGRNANRRVAILVLEAVAAGAPVTARSGEESMPASATPGTTIADANSTGNRLLWKVPPEQLGKTVFVKEQAAAKTQTDEAKSAPDHPDAPAATEAVQAVKDSPQTP
jgi:hypothetical protein